MVEVPEESGPEKSRATERGGGAQACAHSLELYTLLPSGAVWNLSLQLHAYTYKCAQITPVGLDFQRLVKPFQCKNRRRFFHSRCLRNKAPRAHLLHDWNVVFVMPLGPDIYSPQNNAAR